ncbi:hypothetical protein KY290_008248 [Solanum tuberosum]|uniref:RWP-RK domain-containing protein n=1 Tax=Solanum tuberosum TaxID=4113 RepID=A0ABQ7WAK6_SOLTU|nr:hypothetical protein KY285_008194 [Solanum tuberosum]KAH0776837.1 hypothetical protein KY290_008248 [Solanum tuberosum]
MKCYDSKKNNAIERIEKDYGITRQILEQHFGRTLQHAAKALHVSRSTLKRMCKEYCISRWPHHKTRKVYHHVSQDTSLPGVGDQQCSPLSQIKGADHLVYETSRPIGESYDSVMMTEEVTCGSDIIKFDLSPSLTRVELEGEVEKRLNIPLQIFPIKYLDTDGDCNLIEDCITSSNPAKSSHLPLAEVTSQARNESQPTKLTVPFSGKVETSQHISTTNVGVGAHQIGCSNVISKDLVSPLLGIDSTLNYKRLFQASNYLTFLECGVPYVKSLKKLETSVALILKGLREVNIINLSPLEVLLEDFFKKHGDYEAARMSTSQKVTADSHQELLSAAQQCLDTANEEKVNMDKHLEELQKFHTRAEKKLKV